MKTTPSHTQLKGDKGPRNLACVCTRIIFLHSELPGSFDTFPVPLGAPALPIPWTHAQLPYKVPQCEAPQLSCLLSMGQAQPPGLRFSLCDPNLHTPVRERMLFSAHFAPDRCQVGSRAGPRSPTLPGGSCLRPSLSGAYSLGWFSPHRITRRTVGWCWPLRSSSAWRADTDKKAGSGRASCASAPGRGAGQ